MLPGQTFRFLLKSLFLVRIKIKAVTEVKHTTLLNGWQTMRSLMKLALFTEAEDLTTAKFVHL